MKEKPCDETVRAGRLAKARQFLAAAEEIKPSGGEGTDAYVTLCVHAGIAAADVICCRRLGRHAQGDNHAEAVALLKSADPEAAQRLATLLGLKSKAGYTHEPVS
ncbi:MAG TPA: hypothetical protein VFN61_07905, partial [Acidimicrobiales bacterium]|nr:hypothetical protein [Acidimicrobiales bacterium]